MVPWVRTVRTRPQYRTHRAGPVQMPLGRQRRRERPRPVRRDEDPHAGPSDRDDVRLDVGTGDGRAGSGPAGGRHVDAGGGPGRGDLVGHDAGGAARAPEVAANSTSAGGPPDPAGAAAAGALVPGAKSPRSAGLEALGDPAALLSGADPGHSPAGPLPIGVNPLSALGVGTISRAHVFRHVSERLFRKHELVGKSRTSHSKPSTAVWSSVGCAARIRAPATGGRSPPPHPECGWPGLHP